MAKISIWGSIAVAFLAILMIVEAKSTEESSDRIVGGQPAKPAQFPYQVSIRRPDDNQHLCGGAIIGDHFVLTAANCTQGTYSVPSNVVAVVGTLRLAVGTSYTGVLYTVSRITNHPQFNRQTMAHDISVIRTTIKIVFNQLVRAIKLPTQNIGDGFTTTISGWGQNAVSTQLSNFSQLICKIISFPWSICEGEQSGAIECSAFPPYDCIDETTLH